MIVKLEGVFESLMRLSQRHFKGGKPRPVKSIRPDAEVCQVVESIAESQNITESVIFSAFVNVGLTAWLEDGADPHKLARLIREKHPD